MGNSIVNNIIPGFGVSASSTEPTSSVGELCLKISKYAAFIFGCMAIGFAAGSLPGIVIAAGIAVGILLIAWKIQEIWKASFCNSILPPEILNKIPNKGPKLGKNSCADLTLSSKVEETYNLKKQLIAGAEHSIELSANYGDGKALKEVLNTIENRMTERPNLKVHIICARDLLDKENEAYLNRLSQNPNFKYILTSAEWILEPELAAAENHVKLLVVDEKYFVMGGSSITDAMTRSEPIEPSEKKFSLDLHLVLPTAYCDVDVIGKGKVATTMREQFFKLYSIWERKTQGSSISHHFSIKGVKANLTDIDKCLLNHKKVKLFVSGPEHSENNPITQEYANMIRTAKKTVRFANSQFNPAKEIVEALQEKRDAKVKVMGQFNSKANTIAKMTLVYPSRINYNHLDEAYEYDKEGVLYHKKIMTIDDEKTIIGSYNFSSKSHKYDHEIALEIEDEEFTKLANQSLDEDLKSSVQHVNENTFLQKIQSIFGHIMGSITYNFN